MPRVNTVEKSRKEQSCGSCGETIPVGAGYRWIKPRYGGKRTRCLKPACRFRSSDLVSSDKLQRVYGAQETIEDFIASWDGLDLDDVKNALDEAATEIDDVASEYRESADNIRSSFSESTTADDCEEKADGLESWAQELRDAVDSIDDRPFPADEEEDEEDDSASEDEREEAKKAAEAKAEKLQEWIDEVKSAVHDALGNCPL